MFLYRQWVVATTFNGGVIGHYQALLTADSANTSDNARRRYIFTIDIVGGQRREF